MVEVGLLLDKLPVFERIQRGHLVFIMDRWVDSWVDVIIMKFTCFEGC